MWPSEGDWGNVSTFPLHKWQILEAKNPLQLERIQKELNGKICEDMLDQLANREAPQVTFELTEESITKETEKKQHGCQVHTLLPGFHTCFLKS